MRIWILMFGFKGLKGLCHSCLVHFVKNASWCILIYYGTLELNIQYTGNNQGEVQTWEICSVDYMNTKLTLIWTSEKASQMTPKNFSWKINLYYTCRHIKVVTQWFDYTKKHVSRLNKLFFYTLLIVHGEPEYSFSTFAARFKFPKLFLLILLILKYF